MNAAFCPLSNIEFYKASIHLLEEIFPENWFLETKEINHRAFLHWCLSHVLLAQNGAINLHSQFYLLPDFARMLLDMQALIKVSEGDLNFFKFGSFDGYGNSDVKTKIESRLTDAKLYEDLMVELNIGGWYKLETDNIVTPLEKDGHPDIKIQFENSNDILFVECKNLWIHNKNRINKIIKKANRQIKTAASSEPNNSYGSVVLNVSIPSSVGLVKNDIIPNKIQEINKDINSAINGNKNKSVDAVIVFWEDYLIYDHYLMTNFAFRHNIEHVYHKNPDSSIPRSLTLFEGSTVEYSLHHVPWLP